MNSHQNDSCVATISSAVVGHAQAVASVSRKTSMYTIWKCSTFFQCSAMSYQTSIATGHWRPPVGNILWLNLCTTWLLKTTF